MPFVLCLALLASATAAPTTKGRRANERPKVRLVVTGETNVARTTRGARASNRVAQMAASNPRGGNVKMTIRAAHNTLTVVEFEDNSTARAFQDQAERSGLRVEEDQRRFLATSSASATRTQPLAEETPWGIERVYNGAVPNASFFPSAVTHPLCIIDSGYLLTHPDLPSDATAADPSQAGPAGTMYFGDDICNHGTHALSAALSAAIILCLGGGGPSSTDAFQTFFDDGILSIAAAGNGGSSSYIYPASYPSVMSGAATDISDAKASFSQFNDEVDIAAPGVDVVSTVGPPSDTGVGPPGYDSYDGTSMATPHVPGLAMVLWNKYPSYTNAEVRTALEGGAKDLGEPWPNWLSQIGRASCRERV